ncbi:MAG: DUF3050 domain-containing protein [Gilvibacter sp.]|nr:DUF3050 domain-containing protein [Gilvibacter sp.]NQX77104.1 DUF3050 domain-containing protein [Gilvibacter sp.]
MFNVEHILKTIQPLREKLQSHPLYAELGDLEDIKIFMGIHVFAVWDFMSLLKSLQQHLTNVQTPWTPPKHPELARFINEIVFGEESDVNELGIAQSHFEMYRESMQQVGAPTIEIDSFLQKIGHGVPVNVALDSVTVDQGIKEFVNYTFEIIQTQEAHKIAAAFTFGREDLIPEMFIGILNEIDSKNEQYTKLRYYLERHIELDGDEHGPLSLQMVSHLCGTDSQKWQEALNVAEEALTKRILLWDTIHQAIRVNKAELLSQV